MGEKPKEIKEIVADALGKATTNERAAYLDAACGADVALRREVESLLELEGRVGDFLEVPALDRGVTIDESPLSEGPGAVIGRYKLLERIGEGGMAVVYMAEQEQPIRRKVALKIIKLGMDTKQVIARFEAERQALAMMDHPNIAKVLDAGATETGRPYFVMELVTGTSITEYSDENSLNTKDRLALFLQICHAVQHAHQKGIIHRDIKPSNVLVTMHHGKPIPKVIDFGIAKATNQKLTEKTLFTRYAHIIGTPAYMSPEQAELTDSDVDTRTDVYSLGVLLYELLTGTTPFSEDKLRRAGYLEMQRVIREEEPVPPSTKLHALADDSKEVAQRQCTSSDALRRLIVGDLDWVVMKSLEKDRTRRYETAHSLAEDIARHLDDEPVQAGPPSGLYRFRKFLRKNRRAVLAVGSVIVAVVAALILSLLFYGKAKERAHEAIRQAGVAEKQRLRAEEQELLTRRHLYASNMRHAWSELQLGNAPRAEAVLRFQIPKGEGQDLRCFEWYHLWALCHADCLTIEGRSRCAAYAPDGMSLALGGSSGAVRIVDPATGVVLTTLPVEGEDVFAVTFSPDGRRLAARGDGWIRVWSLPAYEVVCTSDNALLVLEPPEFPPEVKQMLQQVGQDPNAVRGGIDPDILSFSTPAEELAVGLSDGWVLILQTDTGQELARFKAHSEGSVLVAFLADAPTLLTLGQRRWDELKVWDVTTIDSATLLSRYAAGEVSRAKSLSSNGRTFLACVRDMSAFDPKHKLNFRQTKDGQAVSSIEVSDLPETCRFSPLGDFAAIGFFGGTVGLYEVQTGRALATPQKRLGSPISVSSDGQIVVLASSDKTMIWDVSQIENPKRTEMHRPRDCMETLRQALDHAGCPGLRLSVERRGCISVLSDGRRLLAQPGFHVTVTEHAVRTTSYAISWVESGKTLDLLGEGDPRWMSFSPNGKLLAIAGAEGAVVLWSLESHEEVSRLHSSTVELPTPDDFLWLLPERRRDFADSMRVNFWGPLEFSPDGEYLAAAGYRGQVVMWDVGTGQEASHFNCGQTIGRIAFSPDGEAVAIAGREDVSLWRASTGERLATIAAPVPPFSFFSRPLEGAGIAFSPDGNTLAIGSPDGTIRLWDLQLHAERCNLKQPEGPVSFLAFGSDGKTLISGYDTAAYVWRGHDRGAAVGSGVGTATEVLEPALPPSSDRQ